MTCTEEIGAHVTRERVRKGAAAMERAGFRLVYECPLAASDAERRRWRARWTTKGIGDWYAFGNVFTTPGEGGRMT